MKPIYIFAFILHFSCSSNPTQSINDSVSESNDKHSKLISKKEFKIWPFTVESGILRCESGIYITFEANGKIYRVNGAAGTNNKVNDIEEIWAIDEKQKKELMDIGVSEKNATTRINIGEILDFGQTLCK